MSGVGACRLLKKKLTPLTGAMTDTAEGEEGGSTFSFIYDIGKIPCMRTALLWGIISGVAIGAHKVKHHGKYPLYHDRPPRAFDAPSPPRPGRAVRRICCIACRSA